MEQKNIIRFKLQYIKSIYPCYISYNSDNLIILIEKFIYKLDMRNI